MLNNNHKILKVVSQKSCNVYEAFVLYAITYFFVFIIFCVTLYLIKSASINYENCLYQEYINVNSASEMVSGAGRCQRGEEPTH